MISMDITYSSIAVLSCVVFLIVGLWEFLNWAWFTPKQLEKKLKEQGFKGLPYRFFIGEPLDPVKGQDFSKPMNLHDDDFRERVMQNHFRRVLEYGKYAYVWRGPTPELIIMDPELIKEITLKTYEFPKAPTSPIAKLLMIGVQGLEGDQWSKHRKVITPAFRVEKLKLMIPEFCQTIGQILKKWEDIISSKGSSEIDVWPYLHMLTADVISRVAFGSNYEEGKVIFELQREQSVYFVKVVTSVYPPGWRFVPTKLHRRMKEISRMVDEKVRAVVDARMKAMKAGEACGDDFLSLLLESNSKEINERGSKDFGLTVEEVAGECKVLYIAGQETTSVLLVWTMILLGRHPEWQNRAREEVLQHFGNHQMPDYTTLNHLKIVTMILYEVLRLYTPVSGFKRVTKEETKLGKFTLPKGVVLILPTALVHLDTELWGDDATKFNPERFSEGISGATKGQVSFFPFSWGPRICLGQNFALMEAKLAIAMILQRFSFELSPSYAHFPQHSALTLQPKYGAPLIFRKLHN